MVEIETILGFISPDFMVIVILLYCMGLFLKQIPNIKDFLIPMILLALGIFVGVVYSVFVLQLGLTMGTIVVAVIQGVLCASVAVFGDQVIKQITQKRFLD